MNMFARIRPSVALSRVKLLVTLATLLLAIVITLAFSPHALAADDDIASGTSGTCTWTIDATGKLTVAPTSGDTGTLAMWNNTIYSSPWYSQRTKITSATFEGTIVARTCYGMFYGCSEMTTVNLKGLDTSSVTTAGCMFTNCKALKSVNLSYLKMSKLTNMYQMFSNCENLTTIDLSSWHAGKVTNLERAFSACYSLLSIDLSGLDNAPISEFAGAFHADSRLVTIDISMLDMSNLKTLDNAFHGCTKVAALNLSRFDTSQVTDMSCVFAGCINVAELDVSTFDTSNVTRMDGMFLGCAALEELDVAHFKTEKVSLMYSMFASCDSLTSLDLSSFDTSNVTSMFSMFDYCDSIEKIIVSDAWSTENVQTSGYMFRECPNIIGASGTSYDPEHTDSEYARIDTAETPGYFWPKETGQDDGGQNGDDPDPGGDPDGPNQPGNGEDPDNPDNPGDIPGNNPGDNPDGPSSPGSSSETPTSPGDSSPSPAAATTTTPAATAALTIAKANVKLSKRSFSFNGKNRMPKATVTIAGKTLVAGRDYTVTYSKGRKKIGAYKVTIKGKGAYKGTVTLTYKIVPAKAKVIKLVAHKNSDGSSGFIASWKRVGKRGAYGYELRWSPDKSFKHAAKIRFARSSKFAKNASAPLLVRNKNWHGKTVYVQVRTWAKVKGKTYTSVWSSAKPVKVKK